MSLIRCPECGTRISEKAKICAYCGYESKDGLIPIAQQEQYLALLTQYYLVPILSLITE